MKPLSRSRHPFPPSSVAGTPPPAANNSPPHHLSEPSSPPPSLFCYLLMLLLEKEEADGHQIAKGKVKADKYSAMRFSDSLVSSPKTPTYEQEEAFNSLKLVMLLLEYDQIPGGSPTWQLCQLSENFGSTNS
ncbi:hypothetical protein L2E82_48239 [Cichorium intybus]|uniref:Uncharacterized protein n=1 Tax=Cichorium intybus TaxID=13427 RepID=A0ACB8YXR1_CICIN|nr:hypothetical protein L2E82_48239 [Cichorium intybus]